MDLSVSFRHFIHADAVVRRNDRIFLPVDQKERHLVLLQSIDRIHLRKPDPVSLLRTQGGNAEQCPAEHLIAESAHENSPEIRKAAVADCERINPEDWK